MKYFQTLPKIITTDYNNNQIVLTNLMKRVSVIDSLLKNPLLFYSYDIKDGDTPEIIANKYYGDSYRYWMVLFSNKIMDPSWDWPMNQSLLNQYIITKYTNEAAEYYEISNNTIQPYQVISYTQSVVFEYRKVMTTIDDISGIMTVTKNPISQYDYFLLNTGSNNFYFNNDTSVTQLIDKEEITINDYEIEMNETKRNIFLINSEYTSQFEDQLQKLMRM